jgi:hypothetical protein
LLNVNNQPILLVIWVGWVDNSVVVCSFN